ncbi:Lrp/AsnC family transcriptional regulator [Halonotius pteroides]|jgi:DNA-binding Lrp family transcriptional regulator|uniref:Lrp/AsnC family transcriptional regulator n=1 Tax=Halonotius pteroides TaxID=268735 RepID=A0A3A6PY55_9EURY|nr:Lrp/AsnC family transcriptional regulator [Halonotius pteroides]RJX48865.1 Lrp/AsnC family transcriptional regulator [Halonotius pteroides]
MDEKQELLSLLSTDAREDVDDIARQLGTDAETVVSLLDELESDGTVRGYQAVIDWDNTDSQHVAAFVELNVELDRETGYKEIADRIARFPAVESLRLVSGDYDFAIEVTGDSMQDVSQFISEQIAPIPEITQTVTHFIMETYKEAGIDFGDRDDDDRLSVSP